MRHVERRVWKFFTGLKTSGRCTVGGRSGKRFPTVLRISRNVCWAENALLIARQSQSGDPLALALLSWHETQLACARSRPFSNRHPCTHALNPAHTLSYSLSISFPPAILLLLLLSLHPFLLSVSPLFASLPTFLSSVFSSFLCFFLFLFLFFSLFFFFFLIKLTRAFEVAQSATRTRQHNHPYPRRSFVSSHVFSVHRFRNTIVSPSEVPTCNLSVRNLRCRPQIELLTLFLSSFPPLREDVWLFFSLFSLFFFLLFFFFFFLLWIIQDFETSFGTVY